jgi:hypothetical protein
MRREGRTNDGPLRERDGRLRSFSNACCESVTCAYLGTRPNPIVRPGTKVGFAPFFGPRTLHGEPGQARRTWGTRPLLNSPRSDIPYLRSHPAMFRHGPGVARHARGRRRRLRFPGNAGPGRRRRSSRSSSPWACRDRDGLRLRPGRGLRGPDSRWLV